MIDPFTIWTIKQVSPKDWGAAIDYDRTDFWDHPVRGPILPPARLDFKGYCFHYWGGPTLAGDEGDPDLQWTAKERCAFWLCRTKTTVRSGERYHIQSKGWRGLAYCAIISPWTGHLLRGRGFRDNGGQLGADLNHTLLAIAWCGGGSQKPHRRARLCFARMWLEYPGPAWCHKDTAGAQTLCPGDWWTPYIREQRFVDELGAMRWRPCGLMTKGGRVLSLTERLRQLGFLERRYRMYRKVVVDAVSMFQASTGIRVDGVCGPATIRALAEAR